MHDLRLFYGGTFDPIHRGHIHTAQAVAAALTPKSLAFIPCFSPVHKDAPITIDHRLNMMTLALEDHPALSIDYWEMDQKRPCYAIETLTYLRQRYPNESLAWVIGSDQDLTTWKDWPDLFKLAHFIRVPRVHNPLPIADALACYLTHNSRDLSSTLYGQLYTLPLTPMIVSSSDIKASIAQGQPTTLCPPKVAAYILRHQLYQHL